MNTMAAITTAQSLARKLGCTGPGPQFACLCPAHEDSSPSLSVTDGKDGQILLNCFAGCSYAAIKAALVQRGIIFEQHVHPRESRIAETYDYNDADGRLVYQVVRLQPKSFRCRKPIAGGGRVWKLDGVERIPYRLPELFQAVKANKWIFVVEGEKDVNTLVHMNLTATCNSGGAGKWPLVFAQYFQGTNVVVIPDNDNAGRRHAFQISQSLLSVAKQVRLIELPGVAHKGDVSDFMRSGHTRDDLIELVNNAPNWDEKSAAEYNKSLHQGCSDSTEPSAPGVAESLASSPSGEASTDAKMLSDIARPEDLSLEDMLERFIHVGRGPVIVDTFSLEKKWKPKEFQAAFAHCRDSFDNKLLERTKQWAHDSRRQYVDAMTFDPNNGRIFSDHGLTHLNLWKPPSWKSLDPTLAAPFLDHLNYVIPDATSRNDLLDWLAHAVQYPEVRPHFHFLLVATTEGIGRGFIGEVIRKLWRPHSSETDLHRLLDDNFNSELSAKIFIVVNEVKAPASERYANKERLKTLLTDASICINEKNLPKWTEGFFARFWMCTNREDALPLNESDRRVYVVRCADKPRDPSYYSELYALLKDTNFLAAVWDTLAARDICGFNPGRRAPLNNMKLQMVAAGRTEDQQHAVEFCESCPFPVLAAVDLMRILVPPDSNENRRDRKARSQPITAVLRETGRQTHAKKIRIGNDTTRAWILSDASEWTACTPAVIGCEAAKARKAFEVGFWDANILMRTWSEAP